MLAKGQNRKWIDYVHELEEYKVERGEQTVSGKI